jgi:hypothetical protein
MPTIKNKPQGTRSSIRFEPPTLDDAIFAAQGLASDVEGQTQIAAMLMGMPEAEVRAAVLKAVASAASTRRPLPLSPSRPVSRRPLVVVERRAPRPLMR